MRRRKLGNRHSSRRTLRSRILRGCSRHGSIVRLEDQAEVRLRLVLNPQGNRARAILHPNLKIGFLAACLSLQFAQPCADRIPRMIGEKWSECLLSSKVRAFNLWILRHGSIQANTIPSAHVAIAAPCARVLLETGPMRVGLGFLGASGGVAFGAMAGRYHYGADAVLGLVFAAAAFLAAALFVRM
jgi:hypothetical protein